MGWEDSLEKEMASYSSILAWEIPWTEDPGGLQSMGLQKSQARQRLRNNSNKHVMIEKLPHILTEVNLWGMDEKGTTCSTGEAGLGKAS